MSERFKPRKYVAMLELQGDRDDQLRWLACLVGRCCEQIRRLRDEVGRLKGRVTKLKRKGR